MFQLLTVIFFFVGIIIFIVSAMHYKSIFNPLGLFAIIWGTLPYVYSLRLMWILVPLSDMTYLALFGSFLSFIIGALIVSKRSYKRLSGINFSFTILEKYKLKAFYWIMLLVAICEMFIKRPALLSDNPLGAYMEGVGVRFLHFSVVVLPTVATLLYLNKDIKSKKRFLMLIPPFIIPLLWGQRGISIGYVLGIMFVTTMSMKYRKQLLYYGLGVLLLFQMVIFVGEIRSNVGGGGKSINEIAGVDENVPAAVVWAYSYTTPSILNLEQTISNLDTPCFYGFEILEPILSLAQLRVFATEIKKDFKQPYIIYDGFNVPTYLYWCYLNFGFMGFFIIPFVLGILLQIIYNNLNDESKFSLGLFVLFMPSLAYSFHDFLFWNPGVVVNVVILFYIFRKLRCRRRFIGDYCKK